MKTLSNIFEFIKTGKVKERRPLFDELHMNDTVYYYDFMERKIIECTLKKISWSYSRKHGIVQFQSLNQTSYDYTTAGDTSIKKLKDINNKSLLQFLVYKVGPVSNYSFLATTREELEEYLQRNNYEVK